MFSIRPFAPLIALTLTTACGGGGQPAPTAAPAAKATVPATNTSPPSPVAASPVASPSPVSPVAKPAGLASPSPSPSPTAGVTAELRDVNGQVVGMAMFAEQAGGVQVTAEVRNLPPGPHGIHIHAVGRCDPPDFMTAGAHFNPTNRQHGLQNPNGPHAGDLPNIDIAAGGTGRFASFNREVSLGTGANSLFDADGSALVIHAQPDDNMTDPTGNSGGRIACGVIRRG